MRMNSESLHNAVYRTSQKLLDVPVFEHLDSEDQLGPSERRLFDLLQSLGYARIRMVRGDACAIFHPAAMCYYREYGESYVRALEAAVRLTKP